MSERATSSLQRCRAAFAGLVLVVLAHAMTHPGAQAEASVAPGPDWAVDPAAAGQNLPPVGRSLFDYLVTHERGDPAAYEVPFPISALIARIEAELQPDAAGVPSVKAVLIPFGRSLQRAAGTPDFFAYPRVVLAADVEPRPAPAHAGRLVKDRLYLGYHEKAEVIEVISYNEAAGRFEFQVVKDYRAGGSPKVYYANRTICIACHQNAGPIFSRQVWDETNANPRVAAALSRRGRAFYGIELQRGVDVPYAVDNATDRANLYSAYQTLWRRGCDADPVRAVRCRAALYTAALQYRLSGRQGYGELRGNVADVLALNARTSWPAGLHIANPDIPNRDPLVERVNDAGESASVPAAFDPLTPRPPLETWDVAAPSTLARLVAGLSQFIAEADALRLDEHLYRHGVARHAGRSTHRIACTVRRTSTYARHDRVDFECRSRAMDSVPSMQARGRFYSRSARVRDGTLDHLALGDGASPQGKLHDIEITGGHVARHGSHWSATLRIARNGMHVRRGDGNAVESLRLEWDDTRPSASGDPANADANGRVLVGVLDDFAPVHAAVDAMAQETVAGTMDAFSSAPFRRAVAMRALFERLRMPPLEWCCVDDSRMPPAAMESPDSASPMLRAPDTRSDALQSFYRYCAACHLSADRSPPNFLHGAPAVVAANLAHCAQRLYVRLSVWQQRPERRAKTPMPPVYALHGMRIAPAAWRDSAELSALRGYVERLLRAESSKLPQPEELLSLGYENLRGCLP